MTFAFSEAVTGFDNSDVSVSGGTLSAVTPDAGDPSGKTYKATLAVPGLPAASVQLEVPVPLAATWIVAVVASTPAVGVNAPLRSKFYSRIS